VDIKNKYKMHEEIYIIDYNNINIHKGIIYRIIVTINSECFDVEYAIRGHGSYKESDLFDTKGEAKNWLKDIIDKI